MKLRFSFTAFLFLVFLGLGSWYLFYEKKVRPENKKKEDVASKLIPYSLEDIQELEIHPLQDPVISLKRSGSSWLITSPVEDEADSSLVTSLVTSLTNAKEERVIEENPSQLEAFGLAKPQLTLKILKDVNSNIELKFGNPTQVGFGVYAQSSAKPKVLKTSKTLLTAFQKSLFELRNKQLVPLPSSQIKEVEFQSGKGRFVVNRTDSSQWLVQGSPVSESRWSKILSTLTQLKATAIVSESENPLQHGLQKPALKLWVLESSDKPRRALWFSAQGGKVFVKRDDKPTIYEVEKSNLQALSPSLFEVQDDHLLALNRFSISKVVIKKAGTQIELLKEGPVWKFSDPKSDEKVDPGKVESFLTAIQDTTTAKMGTPATNERPQFTIELFETKNEQPTSVGKIEFGKPSGGLVSGKSSYLPQAWSIPLSTFKNLDKSRTDFLESLESVKPTEKKS